MTDYSLVDLETLADECFENALDKGFWGEIEKLDEKFPWYAYKLEMIHSEIDEIMEAIRKDQGDQEVAKEFSDVIIRLLDLWRGLKAFGEIADLSLDWTLREKVDYNKTRPVKHGVRG